MNTEFDNLEALIRVLILDRPNIYKIVKEFTDFLR
jgi:hypothetical protein